MTMLGMSWRCCWPSAMALQLLGSNFHSTFADFQMTLLKVTTVGKVAAKLGMAVCYYDFDGN